MTGKLYRGFNLSIITILVTGFILPVSSDGQTITGFTPDSITAGTGSVLTINGSGFGTTGPDSTHYVEFTSADVNPSTGTSTAPIIPSNEQYLSWTNTQIKVQVPSIAGTGIIGIMIGNKTGPSPNQLIINYGFIDEPFYNKEIPLELDNTNNYGGFTFNLEYSLYNDTLARNAFMRALNTWKCAIGINWIVGPPKSVNIVADDGVNVIKFDTIGDELPAGVAGETFSWADSYCDSGWAMSGVDIEFSKYTSIQWTPNSFQSTALHELGHALDLAHVNNVSDVMNPVEQYPPITQLNKNDIDAGEYIMNLNTQNLYGCSLPMNALPPGSCDQPSPAITSFYPLAAGPGDTVTIRGSNFINTFGVNIGNDSAMSFTIVSPTTIRAVVGADSSGSISVITPGGIASLSGFTFLPVQIASFSPESAGPGDTVTITGNYLQKATSVSFGGVPANYFSVISPTTIKAVVAIGSSGILSVTTPEGTATSPGFTFVPWRPHPVSIPNIHYSTPQSYNKGAPINPVQPINTGGAVPDNIYGQVSTLAGSTTSGYKDGEGTSARFNNPMGVATDTTGNVYVADWGNNLIREISPNGFVKTLAGSGQSGNKNGSAMQASFEYPTGVAVDITGNVYVSDYYYSLVRKISPKGIVSSIYVNYLSGPQCIAINDSTGNIYVGDLNNYIRRMSLNGTWDTLAGNGTKGSSNGDGTSANFNSILGLGVDRTGNIYVGDAANNLIRKITPSGVVTTFAGNGNAGYVNGVATQASFNYPSGIAIDMSGNLYVADEENNLIRKITPSGIVTTLAGNGYPGLANGVTTNAEFDLPNGLAIDKYGNLYVADEGNNAIRKITLTGYTISPALPAGLKFDSTTGIISGTPAALSPATTYTITAYNAGGSSTATINITVLAAKQTITFPNLSTHVYGDADFDPKATASSGLPVTYASSNSSVATIVKGMIHIIGAGTATITASQSGSSDYVKASNVTQSLTVFPAVLTITANNQTKIQGTPNPAFSVIYSGFVNGDNSTALTSEPVISATANQNSPVGSYPVNVSKASAKNYTIKYISGILSVVPIPVPVISGFSPETATTGTVVIIKGTNLNNASSVNFGNTPAASFTVNSSTQITATVGYGNSGNISVKTPYGTASIGGFDYVFSLPSSNFKVSVSGATCRGSSNGAVKILAAQSLPYTATISDNNLDTSYQFTDSLSINNLAAGTYEVCITVKGFSAYSQCYDLVITQPKDLSVYVAVSSSLHEVTLSLSGGRSYEIYLNGKLYTTSESNITLPLIREDNFLMVSTDKSCQGIIKKIINTSEKPVLYPNPVNNMLTIDLGNKVVNKAIVRITNMSGEQVYSRQFESSSGSLQVDMSGFADGSYVLALYTDHSKYTYKIVRIGK